MCRVILLAVLCYTISAHVIPNNHPDGKSDHAYQPQLERKQHYLDGREYVDLGQFEENENKAPETNTELDRITVTLTSNVHVSQNISWYKQPQEFWKPNIAAFPLQGKNSLSADTNESSSKVALPKQSDDVMNIQEINLQEIKSARGTSNEKASQGHPVIDLSEVRDSKSESFRSKDSSPEPDEDEKSEKTTEKSEDEGGGDDDSDERSDDSTEATKTSDSTETTPNAESEEPESEEAEKTTHSAAVDLEEEGSTPSGGSSKSPENKAEKDKKAHEKPGRKLNEKHSPESKKDEQEEEDPSSKATKKDKKKGKKKDEAEKGHPKEEPAKEKSLHEKAEPGGDKKAKSGGDKKKEPEGDNKADPPPGSRLHEGAAKSTKSQYPEMKAMEKGTKSI